MFVVEDEGGSDAPTCFQPFHFGAFPTTFLIALIPARVRNLVSSPLSPSRQRRRLTLPPRPAISVRPSSAFSSSSDARQTRPPLRWFTEIAKPVIFLSLADVAYSGCNPGPLVWRQNSSEIEISPILIPPLWGRRPWWHFLIRITLLVFHSVPMQWKPKADVLSNEKHSFIHSPQNH